MKVYVASSWRNKVQPEVVKALRDAGHQVYDFKNPAPRSGFQWSSIDSDWKQWTFEQYRDALTHPEAEAGFKSDFDAMKWADACVLVLPCGRSAHLEAGWMKGSGKLTLIYIPEMEEPELMYKICDGVYDNIGDITKRLANESLSINPD